MPRTIDAAIVTELAKVEKFPVFFFEADFAGGFTRAWTGLNDISFSGNTYLGKGLVLGFSEIDEPSEIRSTGMNVSLSGIPTDMLSIALNEQYQGRTLNMYFGVLDNTTRQLVGTPGRIFTGLMDVMKISVGRESASINLSVENRLIDLNRTRERRFTHEDQQLDFPGDDGFLQVPLISDISLVWRK